MRLIDVLQGKWLGHPLHPAVVHLPLGLWTMAAVFDVCAIFGLGGAALPRLSFFCVMGGLLTALLAVPTGVADWAPIKKEKPAWRLGLYHMLLNLVALMIWALNFGLRINTLDEGMPMTGAILSTSLVAAAVLLFSGYLGSRMVFDQGTSIARQSKQKWRALATEAGSRVPEEK